MAIDYREADPNGNPIEIALIENTGTYIYEGFAKYGTKSSDPGHLIIRSTLSGSSVTAVTRADGNDKYDNVWDNRASLSYS